MPNAVNDILDIVETRLRLISTANEYSFDIGNNIERGSLDVFKGYNLPKIHFWTTGLDNSRADYGDDERAIPLFIECHSMTRDMPFTTVCNELAADIITALNRTPAAPKVSDAASYDLGGGVQDLVFQKYDNSIGTGQKPWFGVTVAVLIKYNTEIFDMASYSV